MYLYTTHTYAWCTPRINTALVASSVVSAQLLHFGCICIHTYLHISYMNQHSAGGELIGQRAAATLAALPRLSRGVDSRRDFQCRPHRR